MLFKQPVGIERQNCHSILNHDMRSRVLLCILLVVFIYLLVTAIEDTGKIRRVAAVIAFSVLAWFQLSAPLKVAHKKRITNIVINDQPFSPRSTSIPALSTFNATLFRRTNFQG